MMSEKNSTNVIETLTENKTETETMWNGSFCDECGVIAVFKAESDGLELNFCGHHVRKNAEALITKGFKITPENYWL